MRLSEEAVLRPMERRDAEAVLALMEVFYRSDAVVHHASQAVLRRDIADCVGTCPYVEGYVFQMADALLGYAMVAKGYSTEYGGLCLWIEDLYLKPEARGMGLAGRFFDMLEARYAGQAVRCRLEAERQNAHAVHVYERQGYRPSPYLVLDREL